MPDDEAFEYLVTQAIADFLANESTMKVDGIIFPSVQGAGKALNVALFHKASKIEEIDLPGAQKYLPRWGTALRTAGSMAIALPRLFLAKKVIPRSGNRGPQVGIGRTQEAGMM